MLSFNDFNNRYKLKIKATTNKKIYQAFASIGKGNSDIYLKDGPFSCDIGIVNLHESEETHWVVYKNETFLIVMVVLSLKSYLKTL